MSTITTVEEFDAALAAGPYAWPGGYPLYFVMADGEAVAFAAVKEEQALFRQAVAERSAFDSELRAIAIEVNWEDPALFCAHTGERIESAYAEDESAKLPEGGAS